MLTRSSVTTPSGKVITRRKSDGSICRHDRDRAVTSQQVLEQAIGVCAADHCAPLHYPMGGEDRTQTDREVFSPLDMTIFAFLAPCLMAGAQ